MSLGTIVSVDAVPLGSELVQPAYVGDTTLSVRDASAFYENSGYLQLEGVTYAYTAVDGDLDIITLAAPIGIAANAHTVTINDPVNLTVTGNIVNVGPGITMTPVDAHVDTMTIPSGTVVAANVGESVTVWDNTANKVSVQIQATVLEQGTDTSVIAKVDAGQIPFLPLGPRDLTAGQGEGCEFTDRNGVLWVIAILGRSSSPSSDFVGQLAGVTAGTVPSASPTPTVKGALGSLFVLFDAVTDTATVASYDLYVSPVSGFTPDSSTLVLTTTGTYAIVTNLADGTPLQAGIQYFVVLVARNAVGAASASAESSGTPRAASGPDIDANFAYLGQLFANQIVGGSILSPLVLAALIKTADAGARVELDADGLRIYAPDGSLTTRLTTTGTDYFSGNGDFGTITAEGQATFLGPVEIANGATATLDSVFAPGANAPGAACDYYKNTLNFPGLGGTPWTWLDYRSGQMYAFTDLATSGGRNLQAWTLDANGNVTGSVASHGVDRGYTCAGGAAIGSAFWFYLIGSNGAARWYNGPTSQVVTTGTYRGASVGTGDGTYLYTATWAASNITIAKWNPANLTAPVTTWTIAAPSGMSALYGLYVGSGDLGATRFLISLQTTSGTTVTRRVKSYDTAGTPAAHATEDWLPPFSGPNSGLTYDGSVFWQATPGTIARLEGGPHKLSGISAVWYSTYTWRYDATGPGPYESIMSSTPRAFTMISRARIVLNGMPVPAGADHLGFYVGAGSARTAQFRQAESTGAAVILAAGQPNDLVLTGSNPPTVGTFPASTPGALVSGATDGTGPLIEMNGDGTYRLAGVNIDDVAWTNLGNGSKYRVKNGVVYAYVNNSSFTTATGTKVQISTSTIPAAYRPSGPVYGSGYFSGQVGLSQVDTDGNLYGRQNSGSPTSNVSGMVSYPVGL